LLLIPLDLTDKLQVQLLDLTDRLLVPQEVITLIKLHQEAIVEDKIWLVS